MRLDIKSYYHLEDEIRRDNSERLESVINNSLVNDKPLRLLVTGGRQIGLSTMLTYIAVEFLLQGKQIVMISHKLDACADLKKKIKELLKAQVMEYEKVLENVRMMSSTQPLDGIGKDVIVLVDNCDYLDKSSSISHLIPRLKNVILFTTPYQKNLGYVLLKNSIVKNIVMNNPLNLDKISDLIYNRGNWDEEHYYNTILGRYYDESQRITVNNIKINKVVYALMLSRMLEFEQKHGRKMSVNEYIVTLIKADVLNKLTS